MIAARTSSVASARPAVASVSRASTFAQVPLRAHVVVRAEPEEATPAAPKVEEVAVPITPTPTPKAAPGIGELMAFDGAAPELINGRLAMLAFVSAVGAELATGTPVVAQFAKEPTLILISVVLFAAGTLAPMLAGEGDKRTSALLFKGKGEKTAFGPFKPDAEMLNGRAAMIGFAAMLAIELSKGSALF